MPTLKQAVEPFSTDAARSMITKLTCACIHFEKIWSAQGSWRNSVRKVSADNVILFDGGTGVLASHNHSLAHVDTALKT